MTEPRQPREPPQPRACEECSTSYTPFRDFPGAKSKYCGDACRYKAQRRSKKQRGTLGNGSHRDRARKHGVLYETIEATRVYKRDGWRCQLCKRKVNRTRTYPHPMSASLDHVIPISRGGDHLYANVQLAHLRCNLNKGAAGGSDQLALIG